MAFDAVNPALDDSAIHVWVLGLAEGEGDNRYFWDCLDLEERSRAGRFRSAKAQDGYVRTRGYLRVLLGRYLDRDPLAIGLVSNTWGKPRLSGTGEDRGLVFNISHSGNRALLAFARDTALGVDMEWVRPRNNLAGLVRTCLAPSEMAHWEKAEQQLSEFIRLWVCKEAFVKAAGRGIGMGMKRAVVNAGFDGFLDIPGEYGEVSEWRLREWGFGDFRAAVAFKGGDREILVLE